MTNVPGADADAIAIHNAFSKVVQYTGAGLTAANISAVKSDQPADPFQGAGSSARMIKFEILKAVFSADPDKGNEIVEASGLNWSVIDITDRDDIGAWDLIVERAS
jgi:hypothetical protein